MLQGSMLNTLLNRINTSTPKQVELSPGQVFKGTVLKLYPDNTALVQMGGLQVHAKLEANLEAGQKAWLQVQPNSDVVTLKVLNGESRSADASLEGLMRSLGIADSKENKAMVQALINANLPVNKEMMKAFGEITKSMDISKATIDAFMLAVKRNLPLTKEVVGSLKAFMSEQPLTQTIQTFLIEAEKFLKAASKSNQPSGQLQTALLKNGNGSAVQQAGEGQIGGNPQRITQTVQQLKEKLGSLPLQLFDQTKQTQPGETGAPAEQLANHVQQRQASAPNNSTSAPVPTLTSATQTNELSQTSPTSGLPASSSMQQSLNSSVQQASGTSGQEAAFAGAGNKLDNPSPTQLPLQTSGGGATDRPQGVALPQNDKNRPAVVIASNTEYDQRRATVQQQDGPVSSQQSGTTEQKSITAPLHDTNRQLAANPQDRHEPTTQTQNAQAAERRLGTDVPNQLFNAQEGAEKSNPLKELFRHLGVSHERQIMNHTLSAAAMGDAKGEMNFDSVKSLLLQVTQASGNSIPNSLRDSADQLLQQITGQQLVLAQQPNTSTLSQVVIQVPLRNGQDEDTAYVQIEAKKRDGGQLDADNCRLLFNLDLQSLGITMVDVVIVKKIVNVQIYNDQPWLDGLAYQMKEQFHAQLRDVGYQLSSMRVQPLPEEQVKKAAQKSTGKLLTDYKGMDVRI